MVIHLGDHWDMPSLSSYDKGKKSYEGRRYKADVDAGNEGMEMLLSRVKRMKNRPRMVFLKGNHEDRITRLIESDPYLEGAVGFQDLNLDAWEVHDFLEPVEIDGVHYAHYWINPLTGRPISGSIDNMLRTIGFSFTQGHRQGLWAGRRELNNGKAQRGLVAGSYYQHHEKYLGPQGNFHWRGLLVCHEVHDGDYNLMEVDMPFLRRRFGPQS